MTSPGRSKPLGASDPTRVGSYRLVRRLGMGGMGTVYLGVDESGRQVAVKVVHANLARLAEFRDRFKREADSARRVARFCTAAVLAVDVAADVPYLVTEYVDGPTLAEAVSGRGPLSPAELHQLAVSMTTALMAIHWAGIVHRDLKPSNILLSRLGPKVIDFGIARALDSASQLGGDTQIGTPAFMAPEQALGRPVTSAADVFAWGGVLVYAGTGRYPFGGGPAAGQLYRTVNDPPTLDGFEASLRPLVEEALRKEPARRPPAERLYAQLLDLRVDDSAVPDAAPMPLSEVTALIRPLSLTSPPTPGRPTADAFSDVLETVLGDGPGEPGRHWSPAPERRGGGDPSGAARAGASGGDPAAAVDAGPARPGFGRSLPVLAALVAAVVGLIALVFALAGRNGGGASNGPERVAAEALRVQSSDVGLARRLALAAYRASPDSPTIRAAMIAMYGGDVVPATADVGGQVLAADLNADGTLLAAGTVDGEVDLWDVSDPAHPDPVGTLTAADWVYAVAFNLSGTIVAAGGGDHTVRLWDITDPTRPVDLSTIDYHGDRVRSVEFSPDGNTLVSGSEDGTVALWDVTDPADPGPRSHLDGGVGGVRTVAFAPPGGLLAFGGDDGTVRLWDVADAAHSQPHAVLRGHTRTVQAVAFDRDGALLASGGVDGTVRLWDVRAGEARASSSLVSGHVAGVTGVAFRSDTGVVASASEDETVGLTDVSDPTRPGWLTALHGHARAVAAVTFTPDGNTAVSAGHDGTVRLWDLDPARLADTACVDPANRISAVEWADRFGDAATPALCG